MKTFHFLLGFTLQRGYTRNAEGPKNSGNFPPLKHPVKARFCFSLLLLLSALFLAIAVPALGQTDSEEKKPGYKGPISRDELLKEYRKGEMIDGYIINARDLLELFKQEYKLPIEVYFAKIQGDFSMNDISKEIQDQVIEVKKTGLPKERIELLDKSAISYIFPINKEVTIKKSIFVDKFNVGKFELNKLSAVIQFKTHVSFSYTQFKEASFESVIFAGGFTFFDNTQFSGETASFEKTQFNSERTFFSHSEFTCAETSFKLSQFAGEETSFLFAKFTGRFIKFNNSHFTGETNFSFTTWGEDITTGNTSQVDFSEAQFGKGEVLKKIREEEWENGAEKEGNTEIETQVNKDDHGKYLGSKTSQTVEIPVTHPQTLFDYNNFLARVTFQDVHVHPDHRISFRKSKFHFPANFIHGSFLGQEQDFHDVKFFSHVDFSNANFGKGTTFLNTSFDLPEVLKKEKEKTYSERLSTIWQQSDPVFNALPEPSLLAGYSFDQTSFEDGKIPILAQANFEIHNEWIRMWLRLFFIIIIFTLLIFLYVHKRQATKYSFLMFT